MKKIQFQSKHYLSPTSNSSILSLSEITHLLQTYSNSKSLPQGKQLHQKIIQHSLHNNHFILTKLIQFYADNDHISYAHKLFDKLSQPNVFAWTSILAHYSRNNLFHNCLHAYVEMRRSMPAVIPDTYVFPKVLRATAQLKYLDMGASIHKDLIVYAAEKDLLVCNSLIDMYSKCEDIKSARRVFIDMEVKDLLSWNSLISGYVSNGYPTLAIELFGSMRSGEPDIVTLNTVMDAYCRTGKCDEALRIFAQMKELPPNIVSWTTLISGFSRSGMHERSLGIFRDMMRMNISGVIIPDPHSLAIAVASCRHLGALRNGQEIHAYGLKIHDMFAFYESCGPAMLVMYSKCGRVFYSRNVFELMDKFDVVTWNAIISGFADHDMGSLALKYFAKMRSTGIKNDAVTISSLLPVCDVESGKLFHAYVLRNGFDSNTPVLNALISMYSKCGCINAAYLVFSTMATRDLVSWNAMIRGFGMHGQGRFAIRLLQEMDLQPDSVTFTSAISACSHSGLVDQGLELFHYMSRKYGVFPSTEHFSCVVDMLSRAGRLNEAVALLNEMGMKTSKHMWGTLLAASESEENIEVAKLAAEKLVNLEPENAGHYVTLSNIYARGERWDDAIMVRKLMEVRGLVKPIGTSWFVDET